MKRTRSAFGRAVVLLALLGAGGAAVRGETLGDGWAFRRALQFKQARSDAPGDNLAWAEFYTNGKHLKDGADLRVTTADRFVVPARVLQVSGQSDLVRVAFLTRSDGPYYVWWGNPKAEKPGPQLEVKRGVFVEIFKFPGGAVDNEEQLRKVYERAGAPAGCVFVPQVNLGYNPLGEEWNTMFRYTAQFKTDTPMTYEIAFAADDTGRLVIDGKTLLTCFNTAWLRDARNKKTLELKPGWHTLEVEQINFGGETSVAVAWRRPGGRDFTLIPPTLYAPAVQATAGALEAPPKPYTADFAVEPAAEVFVPPGDWMLRYVFEAHIPANFNKPAVTWDFGDGQSSTESKVHHYFLTPGVYPVTLTVRQGGNEFSTTQRVAVKDRLYERFPRPAEDAYRTAAGILEKYDLKKLGAEQRLRGMLLCKKHEATDEWLRWGQAWLESKDAQPETVVWEETQDLARVLEGRGRYAEAATAYELMSQKSISLEARLNALRYQVMELCDYLGDPDKATKVAEAWRDNPNAKGKPAQHAIATALIYAAVAKGDGKLAAKLAEEAGTRKNQPFNQQQINQGVLARNVETYIRTKDYETALKLINQWEADYPEAILEGFTRLLRVKLLAAQERPLIAAQVAQQYVRGVPGSFYAAELLYRAAESYKAAGKEAEARVVMDQLRQKYPESPYAREPAK